MGRPSLTQVWVDDGRVQNQPEKDAAPFIVLPPIVRIEPGKGQSWRLVFNGSRLPQDRESLFWFNLLDIPPEPKMARLTITCSSRYGRVSSCFTVRQAWRRKNSRGKSPELGAGSYGQRVAGEQCLSALYHHRQHHP